MAQCIYNKGCDVETTLPELPSYLNPYGKLIVTSDEGCEKINLKNWYTIEVGNDLCNDLEEDLNIADYPYLESMVIGSGSLMNVTQVIFKNLPTFNMLTVGENAFMNTNRVVVESSIILSQLNG